jgi:hypothetical protein
MKAQRSTSRKSDHSQPTEGKLLSVRSAFVIALGLLVGMGAAALLRLGHQPVALAVLGALGAAAAGITFFDKLIE